MAKRKFNENYIQYGFTSIFDIRKEKCVGESAF